MNKIKFLIITTFILMFSYGCSESKKEVVVVKDEPISFEQPKLEAEQFNFNKEIFTVKITERNNNSLVDKESNGFASQLSYIDDEGKLHFFFDSEKPTENTKFALVFDAYDEDFLIAHETVLMDNLIPFKSTEVHNKAVNNANRLMLNSELKFETEEENLIIYYEGEKFEVGKGESLELSKSNGETKSTYIVENLGNKNTKEEMSYDEGEQAEQK